MLFETDKVHVDLGISVAENTNTMLAYWDNDLICRYANKAYLYWFGIDPVNMIGKMHIKEVLGPLYELNLPRINDALSGKACVFDRYISLPNGQTKRARANYIPHIDDGKVKGFYVNVLDASVISGNRDADTLNVFDHTVNYLQPTSDHLLEDVVETLRSHIFDDFPGIELLAKKHYISESKLKRDFKEKYGETIFAYYRNLQMELAHDYITSKKANKGQMALMLNFSNPSNFSTCYHKYIDDVSGKQLIDRLHAENDERYRAFIEQAPLAIGMVDNELLFLTASQKFITEYKLENKEFVGKCLYDFWPRSKERYQYMLNACLKGKINQSEGQLVEKIDGSPGWMRWDIRPWYKSDKSIGGLLIYTEDITASKIKEEEYKQVSILLNKANEIARIGVWERDFKNNTSTWSGILKEILEVPEDFDPTLQDTLAFYKDDGTRDMIIKLRNETIKNGIPFDIEVEMITGKGKVIRVRSIGFPEFINGKCEKVCGIFQNITKEDKQ